MSGERKSTHYVGDDCPGGHHPRYCKCGWSTDLPEDEHRHDERMREGVIKAADGIGWARFEEQLDSVPERGFS